MLEIGNLLYPAASHARGCLSSRRGGPRYIWCARGLVTHARSRTRYRARGDPQPDAYRMKGKFMPCQSVTSQMVTNRAQPPPTRNSRVVIACARARGRSRAAHRKQFANNRAEWELLLQRARRSSLQLLLLARCVYNPFFIYRIAESFRITRRNRQRGEFANEITRACSRRTNKRELALAESARAPEPAAMWRDDGTRWVLAAYAHPSDTCRWKSGTLIQRDRAIARSLRRFMT